jgi:hypothetical protein
MHCMCIMCRDFSGREQQSCWPAAVFVQGVDSERVAIGHAHMPFVCSKAGVRLLAANSSAYSAQCCAGCESWWLPFLPHPVTLRVRLLSGVLPVQHGGAVGSLDLSTTCSALCALMFVYGRGHTVGHAACMRALSTWPGQARICYSAQCLADLFAAGLVSMVPPAGCRCACADLFYLCSRFCADAAVFSVHYVSTERILEGHAQDLGGTLPCVSQAV